MSEGTGRERLLRVALIVGAALAWRLFLRRVYFGWEESDYGNLAMIRGVLDGRFLHYDMNHMPGYYGLGALLLAVVGDAVVAARTVTITGGLCAVALATLLAERLGGRTLAWIAGALLVVQPELALYSSSSLREPVYVAFILGMLTALSRERMAVAGALAAAAFLVRFDGAMVLGPVLALHALGRGPRPARLAAAFAPLSAAILAWSTYTWIDHGTPFFWAHSVAVNVETGLGAEAMDRGAWLRAGLEVVAGLGLQVFPSRVGLGVALGLPLAWAALPWTRHGLPRTWGLLSLTMLGFWLGVGFTAQHSPDHNLYWKWLCPVVPVVVPLGLWGLLRLGARLPAAGRILGLALVVGQAGYAFQAETRRQVRLSQDLYAPQLQLARWFEGEVPEDVPLLIDNIPACWINRRHHGRSMVSWFDVPVPPGDPAAFAGWIRETGTGWVLWFREDWTQAPVVAPFLAAGGRWSQDGVALVETRREDGYGWILYRVERAADLDDPGLDGYVPRDPLGE